MAEPSSRSAELQAAIQKPCTLNRARLFLLIHSMPPA
jgi:hypothetical protein